MIRQSKRFLQRCAVLSLLTYLFLFSVPSQAELNLELTKGIDRALPIAVVPFAGQARDASNSDTKQAQQNIAATIQSDLQHSGRFKVTDPQSIKRFPHTADGINYRYWQKLGVDDIVVGNVEPAGIGKVKVSFDLIDVYGKAKTGPGGSNYLLASKEFVVKKSDLRRLAHHISDIVYKELTGKAGIFSTRVAYIVVQRTQGKPPQYLLEVSDFDGYDPHVLLHSDQPIMSPAWSPDGKELAYVSFEKKHAEIYVVDVASGKRRLVTSYPGINGAPAWSPNGKQLAVVLSKGGNPRIYTIDLATNKVTVVTRGWSIDTEPSWAPDGKSLLFTSDRGGSPQIYRVNLANGKIARMSFNGSYNASASFAPDGQEIVMLHKNGGLFNVALQNLHTGTFNLLTNLGQDQSPTMAPNGSMVMYATRFGGRGVLAVASTDGRVQMRLPARNGDVQEPAWSPFLS